MARPTVSFLLRMSCMVFATVTTSSFITPSENLHRGARKSFSFASSEETTPMTSSTGLFGTNQQSASPIIVKEGNATDSDTYRTEILNTANLHSAILNVSFDGGHFFGWSAANDETTEIDNTPEENGAPYSFIQSRQRRGRKHRFPRSKVRTVQAAIRFALAKIYGNANPENVSLESCSRTDKGVHARSMIALFSCRAASNNDDGNAEEAEYEYLPLPFGGDLQNLLYVLNRMLPGDIRILSASLPPSARFHPTLDTVSKTYRYSFSVGKYADPLRWRYVWHLDGATDGLPVPTGGFDLRAANGAADAMRGTHDFLAFKGAFRGSERKNGKIVNSVCTLHSLSVEVDLRDDLPVPGLIVGGDESAITYTVTVTGDRFLYKMVRFIVGAIAAVGLGKIDLEDVTEALETGVWNNSLRVCAPPHGLVLKDVDYGEDVLLDWVSTTHTSR